jgi:hypothetical protein
MDSSRQRDRDATSMSINFYKFAEALGFKHFKKGFSNIRRHND